MTRHQFSRRCIPVSLMVSMAVCALLLVAASTAQAASGANPAAAFSSNGVSASVRAVQPAVSGLFQVHAPRAWVDALDGSGLSGKNGVPDFLDSWDAFSARTSSAILKNGYAFTTIDRLQDEVLYAGVQRASTGGPSSAVLEFSQKPGERTLGDLRISVEIDAAGGVGSVRFETFAGEAKGVSKFLPIAILAGEGCNDAGSACLVANGALLEAGYNLTALGKPEKSFSGIQIRTPEDEVVGTFLAVTLPSATCPSNLTTCTANDVTTTIRDVAIRNNDLCSSLNDTIDLRIRTAFASTSNERYDLGLFVSGDGGTVKEPSTAETCYGAAAQAGEGESGAYPDLDTDLFLDIDTTGHSKTPTTDDTCGDLRASTGPVDWIVDVTVGCNIVSNELRIPSCRVWEQNANHKTSCTSLQQAGTGSKCDCTDLVVTAQLNPCATTICNDNNTCTDDSCRVVGTAPNLTAECVYTNDNTNTCSDSSLCTTDSCQAGSCVGTSSVTCTASDQCHEVGTCDPSTGTCSNPVRTGGCDDGNACTVGETCQANGNCGGGSDRTDCTDDNPCTDNSCDPATGCVITDNTGPCSDGTACTTGDVCSGGSCVPGTATVCPEPDQCHTPGTCNPTTGVCSNPAKENGSTCSAGTEGQTPANGGCDAQDTCIDGTCTENLASTGSVCRASACSGDPTCCDLEETCSGTSADCPEDAFKASTVICRESEERCDLPEHCTGDSAFCPGESCQGT
jgi:hypothetical protein